MVGVDVGGCQQSFFWIPQIVRKYCWIQLLRFTALCHTFSVACFLAGIVRILLRLKLRVECWKSSPMIYISLDRELNSALNDIQIIGDDFQPSTRSLRRNRMRAIPASKHATEKVWIEQVKSCLNKPQPVLVSVFKIEFV